MPDNSGEFINPVANAGRQLIEYVGGGVFIILAVAWAWKVDMTLTAINTQMSQMQGMPARLQLIENTRFKREDGAQLAEDIDDLERTVDAAEQRIRVLEQHHKR